MSLHVEVAGSGPAVLFTHGFAATAEMWAGQVAPLAPDHLVIRWDMRGHGRSDSPADPEAYSLAHSVADIIGLLDGQAVSRAVLVGHSLGGFISLEVARQHPDRVAGLVLVDTGPGYRSDTARGDWNEFAERTAARLEKRGLEALGSSSEILAAEHRDPVGLVLTARHVLVQRDAAVIDSLPAIAVPTLVLVGGEDKPYLAGARYMAEKIPAAELEIIEGAGHAPNITHPELFNARLRRFLSERFGD